MAITKAFILGAGLGTRLRPLTNVLPKPLVPVWNEPLVYHALRHCKNAGIREFAINTHHIPEAWENTFPKRKFEDSPIELFYEPILLETGGGIKNISSFIGSDSILVFNGDIITDIDLDGLISAHEASGDVATLAVKSTGPNCNIAVENGRVIDLRNDLGIHPGNHQFTGIYCISSEILELIPENKKISIIPAFLELAKQNKIGSFNADKATWHDIGTIEAYREVHHNSPLRDATDSFIHPSAKVEDGASIERSIIWQNAYISASAILENCIVFSKNKITSNETDQLL